MCAWPLTLRLGPFSMTRATRLAPRKCTRRTDMSPVRHSPNSRGGVPLIIARTAATSERMCVRSATNAFSQSVRSSRNCTSSRSRLSRRPAVVTRGARTAPRRRPVPLQRCSWSVELRLQLRNTAAPCRRLCVPATRRYSARGGCCDACRAGLARRCCEQGRCPGSRRLRAQSPSLMRGWRKVARRCVRFMRPATTHGPCTWRGRSEVRLNVALRRRIGRIPWCRGGRGRTFAFRRSPKVATRWTPSSGCRRTSPARRSPLSTISAWPSTSAVRTRSTAPLFLTPFSSPRTRRLPFSSALPPARPRRRRDACRCSSTRVCFSTSSPRAFCRSASLSWWTLLGVATALWPSGRRGSIRLTWTCLRRTFAPTLSRHIRGRVCCLALWRASTGSTVTRSAECSRTNRTARWPSPPWPLGLLYFPSALPSRRP
eukprot:Opistho-1_new@60717